MQLLWKGNAVDKDFLIIQKMKKGDSEASEQFVRQYYSKIRQYCQIHILDRGYAEDLTQETFERFFRSLSKYRHKGKALNYLYVIAGNLCKNFYKKKQEFTAAFSVDEMADNNPSLNSVEEKIDLEKAMLQLPYEFRNVVILYYFQGLKMKEIAQMLGIELPLVSYRLQRAKELLSILLKRGEQL